MGLVEGLILILIITVVGLIILISSLYSGRTPLEVRLHRHAGHHIMTDHIEAHDILNQLNEFLTDKEYKAAHDWVLAHTNWFCAQRFYLPEGFNHLWLRMRPKVNRMLSMQSWPQDFARREIDTLRLSVLAMIDDARMHLPSIEEHKDVVAYAETVGDNIIDFYPHDVSTEASNIPVRKNI